MRHEESEWYVRGFRDLLAARALMAQDPEEFAEVIVPLCYQSAGKLLQGLLNLPYGTVRRMRNLSEVLVVLRAAGIDPASVQSAVELLAEFGGEFPDGTVILTPEGARMAIAQTEAILHWVEGQLASEPG